MTCPVVGGLPDVGGVPCTEGTPLDCGVPCTIGTFQVGDCEVPIDPVGTGEPGRNVTSDACVFVTAF